jgi:hypothetical protein
MRISLSYDFDPSSNKHNEASAMACLDGGLAFGVVATSIQSLSWALEIIQQLVDSTYL